jgi:cytochrome c peroxidase
MRKTSLLVVLVAGCVVGEDADAISGKKGDSAERAALIASTRASIAFRNVTPIPDPPPVRKALVELGRALAHDKLLSGNKDVSCMTCHPATAGSDDDRHLSMGVTGVGSGVHRTGNFAKGEEGRNAPPFFNLHAMNTLFWDGRVEKLPDGSIRHPAGAQLTSAMMAVMEFGPVSVLPMFPVTARDEMRGFNTENELSSVTDGNFTAIWAGLMTRIGKYPEYRTMFEKAYPGQQFQNMTFAHAANAIGGFIVSEFRANNSAWDRFLDGNDRALDLEQLRGAEVFMRTCVNCHGGSTGSDQLFHNTLLSQFGPGPRSGGDGATLKDDFGRERATGVRGDRYRFRTTPLRNVEFTAPFGHAGQIVDLRDFVAHYSVNFDANGNPIGVVPGPSQNLLEWNKNQIEPRLRSTVLNNRADIVADRDPLFFTGSPIRPEFVDPITAFMIANSDYRAMNRMKHVAPKRVPSGLPVSDGGHQHDCDGSFSDFDEDDDY